MKGSYQRHAHSCRTRRSLLLLAALLVTVLLPPSQAVGDTNNLRLPDMGESIDSFMSIQQEQQLGKAFIRSVRRSLTIIDDPQIADYIQSLGQRLAAYSNQPEQSFHFFVVDSPTINAFAGPGGYIGIHSGMILASQNEDELAAVIAHELAHVTQRHLARAYQSASNMNLPLTAAIIAAIILGGQPELAQLGEATLITAIAGSSQYRINFTRSNEKEADRIGIQTLSRAGYATDAMQHFFTRLLKANQYQEDADLEFLRSHPLTSSRIAESHNILADQRPKKIKGQTTAPEKKHFPLMQSRLRILTTTNIHSLNNFFSNQITQTIASQYGLALTAVHTQQYSKASNILSRLSKQQPDNLTITLARIENELDNGTVKQALIILKEKTHLYPDNLPLTLLRARSLLKNGDNVQAASLLRRYLYKIDATPLWYSLLAEAEGKSGNRSENHQAMAEFHFLMGNNSSALKQIRLAIKHSKEFNNNTQLRIQARREEIEQVIAAEADF